MQVVDKYGNTFGQGHLVITTKSGKSKLPVVTVAWGNITGVLANQTDLQDALDLKVPTSRTLTINGVTQDLSADRSWTISTGITVNTTPITGGSTGRLLFDNAGVVSETNGAFWDVTNQRVGIGTTNPGLPLHVVGGTRLSFTTTSVVHGWGNTLLDLVGNNGTNPGVNEGRLHIGYNQNDPELRVNSGGVMVYTGKWTFIPQIWFAGGITSTHNTAITIDGMTNGVSSGTAGEIFRFTQRGGQFGSFYDAGGGLSEFRIWRQTDNTKYIYLKPGSTSIISSGSLLINTTTDAGFRLDVNGSTRVTSLTTAEIFPISANISLWTNSLNASSRFYTAPVHQDGRINFNAIAGGSDQVLIRAWHTGQFGLGTGSSSAGGALTIRGDSLLIGTSGSLFFMNGTFGPLNVPYRLGISTSATTAAFYSGVGNNQTNIESTKFEFTATSHTFYTGTTTGNQSNPNQFIPLNLSNLGNVTIGSTTDAGFKLDVNGTGRFTGALTVNNDLVINSVGDRSITWAVNDLRLVSGTTNVARFYTSEARFISAVTVAASSSGGILGPNFGGLSANSSNFSTTFFTNPYVNHLQTKMLIAGSDGAYGGNASTQGIGIWIYGGNNTTNNNYGNIVIGHDGTTARGNVLIGTSTNITSSKLTVESTTQGFLPPRMTNAQMLAIATPAEGLVVYDTTNRKLCCYDGSIWQNLF